MQLINDYEPDWVDHTSAMMQAEWAKNESLSIYFLLDAAFKADRALNQVRQLVPGERWRSLYADAANVSERVLSVSPLLIKADPQDKNLVAALAELTSGQPMLSWIVSSLSMEALWKQLAVFRYVRIDNAKYVLRFADTRRLPELFAILTAKQQAFFSQSLRQWKYIGRDAQWHGLALVPLDKDKTVVLDRLVFNTEQTEAALNMNSVDALIEGMSQTFPELYNAFETPFHRYQWITQVLMTDSGRVVGYGEQMACCREAATKSGLLV